MMRCNSFSRLIFPMLSERFKKNVYVLKKSMSDITYIGNPTYNNVYQAQLRLFRTSYTYNKIISFNLSDIGEGIREVIIKEWYVKPGDKVSQFENICEVQSDKASVTITSRYDGMVTKLYHAVDEIALVGKPLIDIDTTENETVVNNDDIKTTLVENKINIPSSASNENTKPISVSKENVVVPVKNTGRNRGIAIPSVRRLAKENNIELMDLQGTGKDGRILKDDILHYIKNQTPLFIEKKDETRIEPIRGYTRAMIKTMTEAMKIPHFVYCDEIHVTNLVKLREKLKEKSKQIDVKITYLPFFIKAVSNGLLRYPILNSRLNDNHENIIYYNNHNIAIAMDTPTGLAVPVLKNVQDKNIIEISKEIIRLQNLGKQSKFSKEDLSDGTFTFSNIGAIGGTYAKPVILPPQVAILALGTFKDVPRFSIDGSIVRETITCISSSADHRIIDGATMARFCNVLKEQIEHPELLFLNI